MSKTAARFALACALVGLAASTAAAYVHYHLLYDPRYASFCDVNATFNCSQVYLSRFGTAFGEPVALFARASSGPRHGGICLAQPAVFPFTRSGSRRAGRGHW